ncbi:cell division protein FtsL [Leuconostoc carnosum]|uniref:Cell division protein FtsL n=2 Tax=Leuconostoc carnosum TaxID=1252 RepID=K0DAW1_LEUCJ|nr:septum formation initiator family protein [Leuconostoc carnosum]AFT81983.1 protein required for the initiation of cell division [Leuconostoc carnosum JB16]KAA8328554.1 cell division protein FtsL [Leuconostoc carnosum]QEA33969.1 cell division protein FtsL [Leuconostoc carnosum]
MAQNAYQYSTSAEALPIRQTNPKTATRVRYQAARWTRKERMMVAFVSAVIMVLMIGVVFSSVQISATHTSINTLQSKIDDTKESNDVLRSDIQDQTSKQNLDKVAKKYNMTLSDDSVRNINR